MDIKLISEYLTDKNKVRLISINEEFYDKRFIINFFEMRFKKGVNTDITNFKCYKLIKAGTCAKSPHLFDNVTMLKIRELKLYNMSSCLNITHLSVNKLLCIFPDTHMPPKLTTTVVGTIIAMEHKLIKNNFTKTIKKIKELYVGSDGEDNVFENCKSDKLHMFGSLSVIPSKFVTVLNLSIMGCDVLYEMDLDALYDGSVKELRIEVSEIKIHLSKIITSLTKLTITKKRFYYGPHSLDVSGVKKDCLPNLKEVIFQIDTSCKDYTVFGNLDHFYCNTMKNTVTPMARNISTQQMDMQSCIFHDNLIALDVTNYESVDANVINKLKFYRTSIGDYCNNFTHINPDCVVYIWQDYYYPMGIGRVFQNISHKHLILNGISPPDNVTHLIMIGNDFRESCDNLKLFAYRGRIDDLVDKLPESLEEIYFGSIECVDVLHKFKQLKRIGCNGVNKIKKIIKADQYFEIDHKETVYDFLVKLYPDIYFKCVV